MKLRNDAWQQVWGDVNPCKYGGIFAQLDGDAIQLFSLEPVRDLVGDGDAVEVGFTFWKSEGYYDPSDLKFNEDAAGVLRSIGADDETWYAKSRVERAVLLFEQRIGREPALERNGGFTEDIFGDELVLGQDGEDIRLGCLEEDDEFRQEVLGEFEIFVCLHAAAGCLPDNEPFLVLGRHNAAEWVREQVVETYDANDPWKCCQCDHEVTFSASSEPSPDSIVDCPSCGQRSLSRWTEESVLNEWRGSMLSAETSGLYRATAEIYHVFDVGNEGPSSNSIGHEAADALVEAYNEGDELDHYIESQVGYDFFSEEALELLKGAPR